MSSKAETSFLNSSNGSFCAYSAARCPLVQVVRASANDLSIGESTIEIMRRSSHAFMSAPTAFLFPRSAGDGLGGGGSGIRKLSWLRALGSAPAALHVATTGRVASARNCVVFH